MALLTSSITFVLGLSILMLAEMEQLQASAFTERTQSRAAAEAALRVAASWFATPEEAVGLPAPGEWILHSRRGDSDLDGVLDEACDGSLESGRWQGYPVAPREPGESMALRMSRACGERESPDLLLVEGPTLTALAANLGPHVVIERLAVFGASPIGDSRTGLSIEVRVAMRRGNLITSRTTAIGRVAPLPALHSDDAIIAGGHLHVEEEALVAWGGARAGGDIHLPRLKSPFFPRSGLPRRPGGAAAGWATGGLTDWNLDTREREFLLTELIGRSVMGELVLSQDIVVPDLPDPWLSFSASGSIFTGGKRAGDGSEKQPWPHDPRVTTVQDDLSFLFALAATTDPLEEGRLAQIADATVGTTAAGSALRRFLLEPGRGEPRWRENGLGPARTAQEWLGAAGERPVIAAFLRGSEKAPESVRLTQPRGIVIVEAMRLELAPAGDAPGVFANMPGEPFLDHGIDADGDGHLDPGTIGNGRWDHDWDGDQVADEEPGDGWELAPDMVAPCFVPLLDADSARRESRPYEAFLNFAYPTDGLPGPVQVRYRAEADGPAAPVEDLDGDGFVLPGRDLHTTLSRDPVGARVLVPAHGHALVANMEGDIVLSGGYQLLGALRAKGDIVLERGACVRLDERLARTGRLSLDLPEATLAAIAFPRPGLKGRGERLPADSGDQEPPTPGEVDRDDSAPPARDAPGQGGRRGPPERGSGPGARRN